MSGALECFENGCKLFGPQHMRALMGVTYSSVPSEMAERLPAALEFAHRNPGAPIDPRSFRGGSNVGLAASADFAILRIDPNPGAQEFLRHLKLPETALVGAVASGSRWWIFRGGGPEQGIVLAPGVRLLAFNEVAPLPPSWFSSKERVVWHSSTPWSGSHVDLDRGGQPGLPLAPLPGGFLSVPVEPKAKRVKS